MKFFLFIIVLMTAGTAVAQSMEGLHDKDPEILASWLEGTFSTTDTELQAQTEGNQTIRIIRFWKDVPDQWYYLERHEAGKPQNINRQWVLRAEQQGRHMMIEINKVLNTDDVAGAKDMAELDEKIDIDELELVSGCELFLTYDGFAVFSGATVEDSCELNLRDEHHVVIEWNITEKKFDWKETGQTAVNEYVWGAKRDAQVYKRQ